MELKIRGERKTSSLPPCQLCSLLPGYHLAFDLFGGLPCAGVACHWGYWLLSNGSHYLIMEERMSLILLLLE